jgi:hypothetical protein
MELEKADRLSPSVPQLTLFCSKTMNFVVVFYFVSVLFFSFFEVHLDLSVSLTRSFSCVATSAVRRLFDVPHNHVVFLSLSEHHQQYVVPPPHHQAFTPFPLHAPWWRPACSEHLYPQSALLFCSIEQIISLRPAQTSEYCSDCRLGQNSLVF